MAQTRTATSWRGVAAGVLISGLTAFEHFKLPPVLPDLLAHHPVQPWIAALFMSVFPLIGLFASRPAGLWLGRVGLAKGLIFAAGFFAAGCIVALSVPQFWQVFLAGRGLEGLGFAIAGIAGPILAARSARIEDLPMVTGLLAGWVPLGQILASALTGIWPDWRFLWFSGLAGAVVVGFLARGAGLDKTGDPQQREKLGTPVQALAAPLLLHGIAAAIFMVWSVQYMAFATWLPRVADLRFGLDLRAGTGIYVLPAVFILIFNIVSGWLLRKSDRLLSLLGAALIFQAIVWLLGPFADGWGAILLLIVYGIGAGVAPACMFHLPHFIEGGRAGPAAFGILMTGRNLGGFLGPLLFPFLVDPEALSSLGLGWFAGVTALGLAATIWLGRLKSRIRAPGDSRPDR